MDHELSPCGSSAGGEGHSTNYNPSPAGSEPTGRTPSYPARGVARRARGIRTDRRAERPATSPSRRLRSIFCHVRQRRSVLARWSCVDQRAAGEGVYILDGPSISPRTPFRPSRREILPMWPLARCAIPAHRALGKRIPSTRPLSSAALMAPPGRRPWSGNNAGSRAGCSPTARDSTPDPRTGRRRHSLHRSCPARAVPHVADTRCSRRSRERDRRVRLRV